MSSTITVDHHFILSSGQTFEEQLFLSASRTKGCLTNLSKYAARSMLSRVTCAPPTPPQSREPKRHWMECFTVDCLHHTFCVKHDALSSLPRTRSRLLRRRRMHSGPLSLIVGTFRGNSCTCRSLWLLLFRFFFAPLRDNTFNFIYNRTHKEIQKRNRTISKEVVNIYTIYILDTIYIIVYLYYKYWYLRNFISYN